MPRRFLRKYRDFARLQRQVDCACYISPIAEPAFFCPRRDCNDSGCLKWPGQPSRFKTSAESALRPAGGNSASSHNLEPLLPNCSTMPNETLPDSPLFGYLTVVDDPAHGACGGDLGINHQGRPLEFHCTAAVAPSRAQQILYGPTLQASLYGEQIGPALLEKAKSRVAVVLVNQSECIELQRHSGQYVVLISEETPSLTESVSRQLLLFPDQFDKSPGVSKTVNEEVLSLLSLLAEAIDLAEPFERIREAIYEAQLIGGEGQGSDARAA